MFNKKPKARVQKKWENSHTTIKKHYKHIVIPLGGVALVGVAATAIFLPLYVKEAAEDEFSKFVTQGGPKNDLAADAKIKYVSLGDSISAGYDGIMQRDFVSFADFIAADLKKAGKLEDYRNFSTTGDKVWDTYNNVILNPANTHAIQEANLITVTLGSNDLMVAIRLLRTNLKALLPGGGKAAPNPLRAFIDANASKGVTTEETLQLVDESLVQLENAIRNKNFAGVLSLIPEYEQTIFDLIKRNLLIMDRDLHQAAPHAKIVFLSPYLPFQNMPDSIKNGKVEENGNKSVADFYQKYVDVFSSVAGFNNFTEHIAMKDLPTFKDNIEDKSKYIKPYGLAVPRALPNVADIHPSTFGHELIGNDLFDIFAKEIGLKDPDQYHTHGRVANTDDIYEIFDPKTKEFSPEYYDESKNPGVSWDLATMVKELLDTEKGTYTLQQFVSDNVGKVLDMFLGGSSSDIYKYSPTKGTAVPLEKNADGIAQKVPETGESLGSQIQNGTNAPMNKIVNSVINLFGMMNDTQFNAIKDALGEKLTPYVPLKVKVDEGGTTKEVDWNAYDESKQKLLGITSVDKTKHMSMYNFNGRITYYEAAIKASIEEQHKIGNDKFASETVVIAGHGDVPDLNFEELGFKNLGDWQFIDKLNSTISNLFTISSQIKDGFDMTNDSFLGIITSQGMLFPMLFGDYTNILDVARINPNTDLDALEKSLKLLAEKTNKDWSWFKGLMTDYLAMGKQKNDDNFGFVKFLTLMNGKTTDELKAFSAGTQEALRKDAGGNLIHTDVLVTRLMMRITDSWKEDKAYDVDQMVDLARRFAVQGMGAVINDPKNPQFKPVKEFFDELFKGASRIVDFIS